MIRTPALFLAAAAAAAAQVAAPTAAAAEPAPPLYPDPLASMPGDGFVDVGPFMVFFERGGTAIAPPADDIMIGFIGLIQHGHADPPVIVLTGASDRPGSEAANMALSCRRALAVRQWLREHGLKSRNIMAVGVGETQPLVPTADGVDEPQNRFVWITLGDGTEPPPAGAVRCSGGGNAAQGHR